MQQLTDALKASEEKNRLLTQKTDSMLVQQTLAIQVFHELKAQYATIQSAFIQPSVRYSDSSNVPTTIVILNVMENLPLPERQKIQNWLKVSLSQQNIHLIVQ